MRSSTRRSSTRNSSTPRRHLARAIGAAIEVGLVGAALALSGCASSTPPAAPPPIETVALVPSGLSFHARLDRAISSDVAHPGEHFTASVVEPLRANDGSVLVPAGAKLVGRVIDVDRLGIGRLTLQFDGVYVNGRVHPIDAQILRIQHGRVIAADATDPATLQAFVYPVLPKDVPAPRIGGGPPAEQTPVTLAKGAQIQLILSRPFGLLLAGDRR